MLLGKDHIQAIFLSARSYHADFAADRKAKEFIKSMTPAPEITYFTGISHETDHYWLEKDLRDWSLREKINVAPAFDGLKITGI